MNNDNLTSVSFWIFLTAGPSLTAPNVFHFISPAFLYPLSFLCGSPLPFHSGFTYAVFFNYYYFESNSESIDMSSTTLYMLHWELTSQSNESHSSVNIRSIAVHPEKKKKKKKKKKKSGPGAAAAALRSDGALQCSPHEINLSPGTSSGEGISAASRTTWATQMNDVMHRGPTFFLFLLGNGCNQLAHHLRLKANTPRKPSSLEHRFYFSCSAAAFWWRKVADDTKRASSHPQDSYRGNLV